MAGARETDPERKTEAPLNSEHLEAIRHLYLVAKYQPNEIWEKHLKLKGFTLAQVQAVTSDLDRRAKARTPWQR